MADETSTTERTETAPAARALPDRAALRAAMAVAKPAPAPVTVTEQPKPPVTPPAEPRQAEPESPTEGDASAKAAAPAKVAERAAATASPPADEFTAPEWQAAFAADPGLRVKVDAIQGDTRLNGTQKVARLAEALASAQGQAASQQSDAARLRELRRRDPDAYIAAIEAQEQRQAYQEQQQLAAAVAASRVLASALGVDPDDEAFQQAGPHEGETYEQGLARLRAFVQQRRAASAQPAAAKPAAKPAATPEAAEAPPPPPAEPATPVPSAAARLLNLEGVRSLMRQPGAKVLTERERSR